MRDNYSVIAGGFRFSVDPTIIEQAMVLRWDNDKINGIVDWYCMHCSR